MSQKQVDYIRNFIVVFVLISGFLGTYLYKDMSKEFVTKEIYNKDNQRYERDISEIKEAQKGLIKTQTIVNEKVSTLSDHVARSNELTVELIKVLTERK